MTLVILKSISQSKYLILLKRSSPRVFPCRSNHLKLFSNILDKYRWRSSFFSKVWLIHWHQGDMFLLFQSHEPLSTFSHKISTMLLALTMICHQAFKLVSDKSILLASLLLTQFVQHSSCWHGTRCFTEVLVDIDLYYVLRITCFYNNDVMSIPKINLN